MIYILRDMSPVQILNGSLFIKICFDNIIIFEENYCKIFSA